MTSTRQRVLVFGGRRAPAPAAMQGSDLILFTEWDAWAAYVDEHPDANARYLELDAVRREMEGDAWRWATELAPIGAEALGWHGRTAAQVAEVTRRLIQHGAGFAVARARRRALSIASLVGPDVDIRTLALDELTRAFVESAHGSAQAGARGPRGLVPGVRHLFVRSLAGAARYALNARARARARADIAALIRSGSLPVGFVVQALRDEAIAGPAIQLIRQRGRPVVKLELSSDGRTLGSGFSADLVIDGRLWLDPYPVDLLMRLALRRRSAMRTIAAALPPELGPVKDAFAAEIVAAAGLTAPALLRRAGRLVRDIACERFVLLGETNRIVTPFTSAARAHNVPVICVQHGIIHDIPQWAEMPFATFAVFGPAYREVLASMGTPVDRIVVTGDPRLDGAVAAPPAERASVLEALGLPADERRRLVLFAANYTTHRLSGSSIERAFETLCTALERLPHALLVVKLHPQGAGRERPYERVLARHPGLAHVVADRDARLTDLIAWSDVVVVHVSSVGFEAAALRTPLIVIATDEGLQEVPFVREGIGHEARDAAELAALVERALSGNLPLPDPERLAAFNARYNGPLDGRAAERLAEAVLTASW